MSEKPEAPPVPVADRAPARDPGRSPQHSRAATPETHPGPEGETGCRELRDLLGDFSEQTGARFG